MSGLHGRHYKWYTAPMNKKILLWSIGIGLFICGVLGYGIYNASQPGKYDVFAQCIADSGAKFYGAFWCPHCQDQKTMFGKSASLLPYIECSTPDGQGQLQVCKDAGITGYPSWDFADGSRENGLVQMDVLAQKTNCPLP